MENFTSEQKEGANKLQFIIAGIMIIVCETPYLSRNMNTTFVVILMILFFSISFLSHKSLLVENIKSTLIILSYCLIELFYKIIGISTAGVGYYYATAKFFFIFFVSLTILPELSLKQKKYYFLFQL